MLPGKTYTPEDFLQILRRRLWLLLLPVALITAAGAIAARKMPNLYRAETVILVAPQRVPESYVRSTVTGRLGDRLQTLRPIIESRTRLEKIIRDLQLYPVERQTRPMEDVVALMRSSIQTVIMRDDAFRISYIGREPKKVMEVTNRLASLYINESVTDRQEQAEGTDAFLQSQLQQTKAQLLDNEKKLETYRKAHALELPSQIESNLQQVRNAQTRVQSAADTINRLQDRRAQAEQALAELQSPAGTSSGGSAALAAGSDSTAAQLDSAEAELSTLETRLKPGHPDLEAARRRVRDLRAQLAAESSTVAANQPRVTPAQRARQQRMSELTDQIAEIDRQIASARADQERAKAAGDAAQTRVDNLPTRESELTELTRDYSTINDMYRNLLAKKEESKIAANLERQQIGERFNLLDPAQLPERPFSPNRTQITSMAAGIGLVLGLALTGLLEYRDRTFKTDRDIAAALGLAVLAAVPLMKSEAEERRQSWRRIFIDAAFGSVALVCGAIVLYTLVR